MEGTEGRGLEGPAIASRLEAVGLSLVATRPLWSERPFTAQSLGWEADRPDLSRALRALPAEALDALEADPSALPDPPAAFSELVTRCREGGRLPRLDARGLALDRPREVPARKWREVSALAGLALAEAPPGLCRWVDWCSGKGHLGRALGLASGLPLVCVERSRRLCGEGARLALAEGARARYVAVDAFEPGSLADFDGETGVVSLHACGTLHVELLRRVAASPPALAAVSPCCYHRGVAREAEPLSKAGARLDLRLARSELRLVGLDEVVARPRRRALRRREEAFRLGLDLLVREATGEGRYHPMGPAPAALVEAGFEPFCRALASRAGVDLPRSFDPAAAEAAGRDRHRVARALGLVRGLFRGPLEAFLLLDRAQLLVEAGLSVRCGRFCPEEVTPRSGVVLARRPSR